MHVQFVQIMMQYRLKETLSTDDMMASEIHVHILYEWKPQPAIFPDANEVTSKKVGLPGTGNQEKEVM